MENKDIGSGTFLSIFFYQFLSEDREKVTVSLIG